MKITPKSSSSAGAVSSKSSVKRAQGSAARGASAASGGATRDVANVLGIPEAEFTPHVRSAIMTLMAEVDRRGGPVAAIESGFVQREILRSALAWQRAVEKGEQVVVGVNEYVVDEKQAPPFRPGGDSQREVLADLAEVRAQRDAAKVENCLAAIESAARGTENVMPHVVAAVEHYATLGEICARLEKVFGKYKPPEVL
mgnify:CR=1 FL=1